MPVLRVRERALRDAGRTRRPRAPRAVAARASSVIVLCAVGVALLGGAVILAALWSVFLGLFCFGIVVAGLPACLMTITSEDYPVVTRVFAAFAAGVLLAAAVSSVALSFAVNEQALRDRGIVERAVVVAEHYQCLSSDGDCSVDYSYTLRSTAGWLIRPDLDTGSSRLAIGSHLTVLADPLGRLRPSTDTRLSAGPSRVTAIVAGGIAAACLLVVAWTAPRPSRRQ